VTPLLELSIEMLECQLKLIQSTKFKQLVIQNLNNLKQYN